MTTDGEKWHYLALKSEPMLHNGKLCNCPVKSLSKLLRGKSSNHHGHFYCLNCFNSYSTENRLKKHEEIRNKTNSCCIIIPRWYEKLLKYKHGEKSLKAPFVICLDLEFLLLKGFHVKIVLKILTLKERLGMSLLAGQCLQNVHLM